MTVSSPEQRRNPSSRRDDNGGTRAGESVKLGECESTGGDVGDKHPVLSSQTQWRSLGQYSGQFLGRFSGKLLGQSPGQLSGRQME